MFERYATALIRDYGTLGAGFTYQLGSARYETVEAALAGYTHDHGEHAEDAQVEECYRILQLDRRDRPVDTIAIGAAREIVGR